MLARVQRVEVGDAINPITRLTRAYELTLKALSLKDRDDPLTQPSLKRYSK
jgi:hypothetical protein